MTRIDRIKRGKLDSDLRDGASSERIDPHVLANRIAEGSIVAIRNKHRKQVTPLIIGSGCRIKVNANIGTSSSMTSIDEEITKMRTAIASGADAIMDLSTCGDPRNIHIGPSDYVPWQDDQKVCFIRMEGKLFGNVPMNLDVRLSVEDSPNSAGVVIDAIRCCRLALDRRIGGVLHGPPAFFCKHPPRQFTCVKGRKYV